jgi:hypothetical protein
VSSGVRRWAICVVGFTSNACLAFAVPPGQASVGGATTGVTARSRPETNYALRAGVYPLGLVDKYQTRMLDFGLGYAREQVALNDERRVAQGPYLEVAAYPLQAPADTWTARYGLRTTVDALVPEEGWDSTGYGASLALAAELTGFAKGAFAASNSSEGVAGFAHGEGGIGAFAGVGHRRFRDDSYWLASAGFSVRLPAAGGIVCCLR